jgi:hypothetical protein
MVETFKLLTTNIQVKLFLLTIDFFEFLQYIYSSYCKVTLDNWKVLLSIGDKFNVSTLKSACFAIMSKFYFKKSEIRQNRKRLFFDIESYKRR